MAPPTELDVQEGRYGTRQGRAVRVSAAVLRNELTITRRDPRLIVLLFVAPVIIIVFLGKALGAASEPGRLPTYAAPTSAAGDRISAVLGSPARTARDLAEARALVRRHAVQLAFSEQQGGRLVAVGDPERPDVVARALARLGRAQATVIAPNGKSYEASTSPYQHTLPGFAVMFAFFGAGFVGVSFFRDQDWSTLRRILALDAPRSSLIVGKAAPVGLIILIQELLIVAGGALVLGVPIREPLLIVLGAVLTAVAGCAVGLFLTGLSKTLLQVQQLTNLVVLLLGVVGGGIAAVATLPGWVQAIAPATPDYWAIALQRGR
jgi:ABC-type Na+ efflux pump permease subunit